MSYKDEIDKLKFDVRMRDFNERYGMLTKDEVQSFENSLPDSADNMEYIQIEDELTTIDNVVEQQGQANDPLGGFGGDNMGGGFGGNNNGFGGGFTL
ncbi:MAG: hypothetical protein AB8E15_04405 [Bdellovibrionales bacterium]